MVGRSLIGQGRARAGESLNEGGRGGSGGEGLIYLIVRAWGVIIFFALNVILNLD